MADGGYLRSHSLRPAGELRPEFFMDSERDDAASAAAGREIYRDIERVKIIIPGMTATVAVHNVHIGHINRWPEAYEAFKKGQAMPLSGTPLAAWPMISKAILKELEYHEIRTVEELANISDNAVSRIGKGMMNLRAHARAFLDDASHEALRTQLQAENDGLRSAIAALQHQVDDMSKNLGALAEENRRYAEEAHMRRTFAEGPAGYPAQPAAGYGGYAAPGAPMPVYAATTTVGKSAIDGFDLPVTRRAAPAPEPPEPARTPYVDERQAAEPPGRVNPPPPWGYANQHDGPPPAPQGPVLDDLRGDIRGEIARAGAIGAAAEAPPRWPQL